MQIEPSSNISNTKYSGYGEYTLSVNEFNRPKVYSGPKAIINKIIELILMNPGTYPTRPYMGVGLIKNYRYDFLDNINEINQKIKDQIQTYLPEFSGVSVNLIGDSVSKTLIIFIEINDYTYSVVLNTETKSLTYLNS